MPSVLAMRNCGCIACQRKLKVIKSNPRIRKKYPHRCVTTSEQKKSTHQVKRSVKKSVSTEKTSPCQETEYSTQSKEKARGSGDLQRSLDSISATCNALGATLGTLGTEIAASFGESLSECRPMNYSYELLKPEKQQVCKMTTQSGLFSRVENPSYTKLKSSNFLKSMENKSSMSKLKRTAR